MICRVDQTTADFWFDRFNDIKMTYYYIILLKTVLNQCLPIIKIAFCTLFTNFKSIWQIIPNNIFIRDGCYLNYTFSIYILQNSAIKIKSKVTYTKTDTSSCSSDNNYLRSYMCYSIIVGCLFVTVCYLESIFVKNNTICWLLFTMDSSLSNFGKAHLKYSNLQKWQEFPRRTHFEWYKDWVRLWSKLGEKWQSLRNRRFWRVFQ